MAADISERGNEETARMIEGIGALAVRCDVSRADAVKAAMEQAIEAFGRVDFAFNNAGVEQPITPTAELTAEPAASERCRIFSERRRDEFGLTKVR